MIHFTCDMCRRNIDSDELRYVVKMEVYAAYDPATQEEDESDRDHLEELQEILERMEDVENDEIGEEVYQIRRYDLCSECRKKFCENPLSMEPSKHFDFSQN